MERKADFLAVVEHRLLPAGARSTALRAAPSKRAMLANSLFGCLSTSALGSGTSAASWIEAGTHFPLFGTCDQVALEPALIRLALS